MVAAQAAAPPRVDRALARGVGRPRFVRCALDAFAFAPRGPAGGGRWWDVRPVGRRTPLHVAYAWEGAEGGAEDDGEGEGERDG